MQTDGHIVFRAGAVAEFSSRRTQCEVVVRFEEGSARSEIENLVAKVEGSDPKLKDEYVVNTAHWDHLGKDPTLTGDQIFNGAADNASGCAGLLELAHAYAKMTPAAKRSILSLAVTAEEKGLIGSPYYAANALYPLTKTLADLNIDDINVWGKTRNLIIVGLGASPLMMRRRKSPTNSAEEILNPDPTPEDGGYYRSDHFEFAKQGVPALSVHAGDDYIGKPCWLWKPGNEFKARRDKMLAAH